MGKAGIIIGVLVVCYIVVVILSFLGFIPAKKWLHLGGNPAATTTVTTTTTVAPTPVDCVMGDWSAWGPCGTDGTLKRTRSPTVQAANGGKDCTGAIVDSMPCQTGGVPAFVLGPITTPTWASYNAPNFPDKTAQIIWATQNAANTQDDMQPKTFVYVYRNDSGAAISATLNAWVDDIATLSATNAGQTVMSPTAIKFADLNKLPVTVPPGDTVFKAVGQNTGGGPSGLLLSLVDSTGTVLFNTGGTGGTWVQGNH
jgi:hypothetical protein